MLNLPKYRLAVKGFRIRNPTATQLTVWLEPWAESHALAPNETIDVVLVGPKEGRPEVLPKPDSIAVYGWEGADAILVKNGQIIVPQSTIDEIIRQEFQIAKDKILRTDAAVHADEIILVQNSMDSILAFRIDSVPDVSKMLGYFIRELAGLCQPTDAATEMLWRVVQRIVATKGFFLAVPRWKMVKTAIWSESPNFLIALIEKNILPVLVDELDTRPRRDSRRQSAEQESRPSSN